jgi:hypothetical protein
MKERGDAKLHHLSPRRHPHVGREPDACGLSLAARERRRRRVVQRRKRRRRKKEENRIGVGGASIDS